MKQVKPCPFECNANDCKDCGAYTYSHHTQTNEEWFCQLSTEEKAEVILKKTTELRLERKWSKRYIEEWLKEKHE